MKLGVLILLVLLFPTIVAVEIDMKTDFNQGETLIAKISGNFIDTILQNNIFFYRGHVRVPMDFAISKINNEYYIYVLLPEVKNNYSLSIEDVRYYQGSQIIDEPIIKEFSISSEKADFSVSPGVIFTNNPFELTVQNLQNKKINIAIDSNFDSISSLDLLSGEIKNIDFDFAEIIPPSLEFIELSSENLVYSIPAYFFGENLFCGDNICSQDENCTNCEIDCGECPEEPFCGDEICNEDENCSSCSEDCGECEEFFCGDEICNEDENCTNCEIDCGVCKGTIDFEFEPYELNISMLVNSKKTNKIILSNIGDISLDNIELSVSNSLKSYVSLSLEEIETLEKNESIELEIKINSTSFEGKLGGHVKAKTYENEYAYMDLYLEFVEDESEIGETSSYKKTCAELQGNICKDNQKCVGQSVESTNENCCLGRCESDSNSGTFRVWGIGLLLVLVFLIIWFFKQYKKTENKPKLFK